MDRGAWPTRVQGLAKSQTRLSDPTTTTYFLTILENRHPRLRCQQVWVLPETSLLGFQVGTFSLGLQVVIAVCVCVHVSRGFPCGSVVKNSPANSGDAASIPGSGSSPRGGNGNPLQHSCLENLMDKSLVGTVHGGCKESDMTEQLATNQHVSSISALSFFLSVLISGYKNTSHID